MSLTSLRQSMRLSLFPYRVGAGLVGTIAILGIFLAGVGLYGLVSYSVSRRTHEIGVRVAMGARPTDVLAARIAGGFVADSHWDGDRARVALATAQVLRAALYHVSPADPIGIVVAVAVVAAVGLSRDLRAGKASPSGKSHDRLARRIGNVEAISFQL